MDGAYWDAARRVIDAVRASGCTESTVACHERTFSLLAAYLDRHGMACTRDGVDGWLSEVGATRRETTVRGHARNSARLLRALDGTLAYDPRLRPAGSRAADALVGWAADAVSAYRDHVAEGHTAAEADEAASHAAQFLIAVAGPDARPEDLTAHAIADYATGFQGPVPSVRQRMSHVRGFLRHAAGCGHLPDWAHMLATPTPTAHGAALVAPEEWPDRHGGIDPREALGASERVRADMLARGYSASISDDVTRLARVLYVALSVSGVPYTRANALAWLDAASATIGGAVPAYSRAARRLDAELGGGAAGEPADDGLGNAPEWSRDEIARYVALRRREGLAESTVGCTRRACVRLAAFADARGVACWGGLGADVVSAWCDEDPHKTAAGRACYASKARGFLSHLESAGVVAPGTAYAARRGRAPSERLVETLTDEQVGAVIEARLSAATPMQLRDAAMVALGLTMGMRASDVVGLSLSDVDWRASSVTFVQRKTSTVTTLPLTAAAGNAILSWLRRGRPACAESRSLFVALRAPHGPLTRRACRAAMVHTLGHGSPSFHCLRRTLATRMLGAGSGRRDVAGALGHRDGRSSEAYLSLDEAHMRACALSPEDCGIGVGVV